MQMLSVKQAANQLQKSEDTIRRWAACGKLPAQKRGGRWIILSTKICDSTLKKKPIALAAITEDAIGKIVEGISEKIGVMANSSSRTNELQEQVDRLSQENKQIKIALTKVYSLAKQLRAEQKQLCDRIAKQEEIITNQAQLIANATAAQPVATQPNSHSEADSTAATKTSGATKIADEEKAERWARNNTDKWLDSSCRAGRTWRELATNFGDMVSIRGRLQKPRSHLHIIMKTDKSAWNRMKAKVALEMFPSETQVTNNHYAHSYEAGGAT